MKLLLIVSLVNLLGCMSVDTRAMNTIRPRVSFELSCPSEEVTLVVLERYKNKHPTTIGAKGCGSQAIYQRDLYAKARPWYRVQ